MGGEADARPVPARWRRRAVVAAAIVLVLAIAIRVTLTIYAADLFVAALARALAGSGAEVVFAEAPSVTFQGFESKGILLRSLAGEEWARADAASGSAHFFPSAPYVSVALTLKGARAAWKPSRSDAKTSPAIELVLPSSISRVELESASVDLGEGRALSVDGEVSSGVDGSTHLEIARLDYSEPEGERTTEKLAGNVTLSRAATPGGAQRLEVSVKSGAALFGTVLLDFTRHPVTLAGTIERGDGGATTLGVLVFNFGKLLRGTGSVTLADGSLGSADVRLASDDLGPAFATLVREPFSGIAPVLVDSGLEGRGEVRLFLAGPSRHRTAATVTLTLESLRTRSVEGDALSIELPWIGAQVKSSSRSGRLRANRLSLLGLPWTGIDVRVDAAPGRLRANSVQEWKAAGGTLRMTYLAYEDDPADGPRVSGIVELFGFDLAELGRVFGMEKLTGSLHGNLGRVRIDGDAVRAEGAARIETFGGSVRLSSLSIKDPFSRVPQLGLDAEVRDIDLGALTQAFGLGRVSGVLEGKVTGLVLADGQAQSFDADLHTVERRGVSQNIDVKAIVQLGVLGGDTGSLTGSLLRMIKHYRYSEMGIRCRLRNDVFEIHGVETRDGRDYLVKGSLLPPSVSVVSHSQVVSFSEMLRRIERITTIGEGGSPNAEPQ